MKVKVISYIPGKTQLTGTYGLEQPGNIVDFLQTLNVQWNHDALVMVNNAIVQPDYVLQDQDEIHLLIPIVGG